MRKKAVLIIFVCIALTLAVTAFEFEKSENALASSVIRLHVIANSDDSYDQQLKLKVRDRIISSMPDIIDENCNITLAKEFVIASLETFASIAEDELRRNGCRHSVNVTFGTADFPTRDYGNLILPAGSYEALRIEIGKAEGQNWWCVLFPPLCFVDESCVTADNSITGSIEESIGKQNTYLIDKGESRKSRIKFKTYEIWQKSKRKLTMLFE